MDVERDALVGYWDIRGMIHSIRGLQVMMDADLALLYRVETKALNRAVKRNITRFPLEFRFQLAAEEMDNLRCQNGTSNGYGGRRYLPYVFTEQGVAMLSAVLKSDTAVNVSIQIMTAFVEMRRFLLNNVQVFQRLDMLESKQVHNDHNFKRIFNALEQKDTVPSRGVFFEGQVFDAHMALSKIIRSAHKSIAIIDNYIDETVLALLTKRKKGVAITLHTQKVTRQMRLDIDKYNSQYPEITVKALKASHDRFIIIDGITVYHVGASLKDLGKKWFAFSRMEREGLKVVDKITA